MQEIAFLEQEKTEETEYHPLLGSLCYFLFQLFY